MASRPGLRLKCCGKGAQQVEKQWHANSTLRCCHTVCDSFYRYWYGCCCYCCYWLVGWFCRRPPHKRTGEIRKRESIVLLFQFSPDLLGLAGWLASSLTWPITEQHNDDDDGEGEQDPWKESHAEYSSAGKKERENECVTQFAAAKQ